MVRGRNVEDHRKIVLSRVTISFVYVCASLASTVRRCQTTSFGVPFTVYRQHTFLSHDSVSRTSREQIARKNTVLLPVALSHSSCA